MPISHVNALEFTGFAAHRADAHTFLAADFDPFAYLPALARSRARIASVVPSVLATLAAVRRPPPLPDLGYLLSAAAPLAAHTAELVGQRLGVLVVHGYGMSEAANFSCTMPPDLDGAAYAELVTRAAVPAVGSPIAGNEVDVLRPDGSIAAASGLATRGPARRSASRSSPTTIPWELTRSARRCARVSAPLRAERGPLHRRAAVAVQRQLARASVLRLSGRGVPARSEPPQLGPRTEGH